MNTEKVKRNEWFVVCYKGKVAIYFNPDSNLKGYPPMTPEYQVLPEMDKNQYQDLYEHIVNVHNNWYKFKDKMRLKKEFTKKMKKHGWEYSNPSKPWSDEDYKKYDEEHKKYDDPSYLYDKSPLDKEFNV